MGVCVLHSCIRTPTIPVSVAEEDEAEHAGITLNPLFHADTICSTLGLRPFTAPKPMRISSFGVWEPG